MREYIERKETTGQLIVDGQSLNSKIICHYEHDVYSCKGMKGTFTFIEIPENYKDFGNLVGKEFEFRGDNGYILKGTINSSSNSNELKFRKYEYKFKIKEMSNWARYDNDIPLNSKISFYSSYIEPLSRDLSFSFGFKEDYIVKFRAERFKLEELKYPVTFEETVSFVDYEDPDLICRRKISPTIIIKYINDEKKFLRKLENIEKYIDDIMLSISFLINFRVSCYGYYVSSYVEREKPNEHYYYKHSRKSPANDYTHNPSSEFYRYFKRDNVTNFISSFLKLTKLDKTKIKRLLNALISIKEITIFEAKFESAFAILQGISKLILEKEKIKLEKTNEKIKKAIEISGANIIFKSKDDNNKKWIITDYRNDLAHYNNDDNHDIGQLIDEYQKMLRLARKLILFYIHPNLIEFPYPDKTI